MKSILARTLGLAAVFGFSVAAVSAQVAVPVGAVAANQTFAVRSGSSFVNSSLDTYKGKILVVMLMTPWCPICQSNTIATGDGILDFFNATSRGVLKGKNDRGIEIGSLLLSTEQASSWDSTNASFSSAQGFQQWGLDAAANRTNPRVMLGYFRGGFIAGSNLYDWGEDRRRVVVVNLVEGSSSHQYREVILNQNYYSSANNAAARAAINAILPAPVLITFTDWVAGQGFAAGTSAPTMDPDGDSVPNLLEFFHGTNPKAADSVGAGITLNTVDGLRSLNFQRRPNINGIAVEYQVSNDLKTWTNLAGIAPAMSDTGEHLQVSVPLPAHSESHAFYRLRVTMQ